jgi:hypothetical protein
MPSGNNLAVIEEVVMFVTDRGLAKHARQRGSVIQRNPPKALIFEADAQLGLGGELIRYMKGRPLTFEDAPEMDDSQWEMMLDARFPARAWKRWHGVVPSASYSVVVVSSPARAEGAAAIANSPKKCLALFVLGGGFEPGTKKCVVAEQFTRSNAAAIDFRGAVFGDNYASALATIRLPFR